MYEFNYHEASDVDEAIKLITQASEGVFMGGGQTLLPTLKQRLANPSDVIDLRNIKELSGIKMDGNSVVIGAMTQHNFVARANDVKKTIPALAHLAGGIGDPQVRNIGTIGGSIANNDPAADYPAAVLGLDAIITTNHRSIGAADFFTGMFETALESGELITSVKFPIPTKAAYMKFPSPASRYAMVGVFIAETAEEIRVAVTGAASCVFRMPEMEQALEGNWSPDAIAGIKPSPDNLNGDIHGSAEYRSNLVNVMAKRAILAAG